MCVCVCVQQLLPDTARGTVSAIRLYVWDRGETECACECMSICERVFKSACVGVCPCMRVVCVCVRERENGWEGGREGWMEGGR